jgi:MFS family permease
MPLFTKPRSAVRAIAMSRLFSYTGSAAAYIALNFLIFEKTHSPVWVSASLFLTFGVAGLAGVLAGALGDRFDRRKVMIYSDLFAGVFFFAMAFVSDPYWLLGLAFCSALAESPMWSASGAAIPALVGKDELTWANSMISLGSNAGIMLGPALGGVLVGIVGASWLFAANAVSYAISAGIVALERMLEEARPTPRESA